MIRAGLGARTDVIDRYTSVGTQGTVKRSSLDTATLALKRRLGTGPGGFLLKPARVVTIEQVRAAFPLMRLLQKPNLPANPNYRLAFAAQLF